MQTFARFTVDSPTPLLNVLRDRKLTLNQQCGTELLRWYENPGLRAHYFASDGLTLDGLREAWQELGYVQDTGVTERDVLDILDGLFSAVTCRPSTATVASQQNANGRAIEQELKRARSNRNRLWTCACGNLFRSAKLTLHVRCEDCGMLFVRTERTVAEILSETPLEAIQSPEYRVTADDVTVPF